MRNLLQLTLDLFDVAPPAAPRPAADPPTPKTPDFHQNPGVSSVKLTVLAPDSGVKDGPGGGLEAVALAPASFVHPRANREVLLQGARVAYAFARSRRRTIGFSVGPDGLSVRAPGWVPLGEVDAALREKSAWILRKLGEARERQAGHEAARINWADGAVLPYLGEPLRLLIDPKHPFSAAGAQLEPGALAAPGAPAQVLRVALAHTASAPQIRDAVQAWLMRQARELFRQRLDHFAPQLGVSWKKLSLSNAGTRWGSARADGSIRLNWRLVHFRLPVIDYVVVHELSHLRVMDHSPQFWDTVESVMPGYAQLRRELRKQSVTPAL
ncbi:MAG: M48 family metallopeptidase [Burkholderiaceae bacterium]|nr:M48 family metallopeptidase [Burkholderiaceae bacterium]